MIAYDVVTKILDTEKIPQYIMSDLNSGITFIVLFSQEKPLRWMELNTDTHTGTHTQTHTNTHNFTTTATNYE